MFYSHREDAAIISCKSCIWKIIVKLLSLVFLFLIQLRFPSGKSIAGIIRKRYGSDTVKQLRKFEKLDYKVRKIRVT